MVDPGPPKTSLKQRISDELKEFAVSAAYLYICFTAIAYFKFAVLQAHGIEFAPFGFAAGKALICAKFMSLGHMVQLGNRHKKQALIWPVLHKSLAFLLLLLVLDATEEVIVGLMHARPIVGSLADGSGADIEWRCLANCAGYRRGGNDATYSGSHSRIGLDACRTALRLRRCTDGEARRICV